MKIVFFFLSLILYSRKNSFEATLFIAAKEPVLGK
jgi:hypothetical protein